MTRHKLQELQKWCKGNLEEVLSDLEKDYDCIKDEILEGLVKVTKLLKWVKKNPNYDKKDYLLKYRIS